MWWKNEEWRRNSVAKVFSLFWKSDHDNETCSLHEKPLKTWGWSFNGKHDISTWDTPPNQVVTHQVLLGPEKNPQMLHRLFIEWREVTQQHTHSHTLTAGRAEPGMDGPQPGCWVGASQFPLCSHRQHSGSLTSALLLQREEEEEEKEDEGGVLPAVCCCPAGTFKRKKGNLLKHIKTPRVEKTIDLNVLWWQFFLCTKHNNFINMSSQWRGIKMMCGYLN